MPPLDHPLLRAKRWLDPEIDYNPDDICPLCRDRFGVEHAVFRTGCGHIFHNDCLNYYCEAIAKDASLYSYRGKNAVVNPDGLLKCPTCRRLLGKDCQSVFTFQYGIQSWEDVSGMGIVLNRSPHITALYKKNERKHPRPILPKDPKERLAREREIWREHYETRVFPNIEELREEQLKEEADAKTVREEQIRQQRELIDAQLAAANRGTRPLPADRVATRTPSQSVKRGLSSLNFLTFTGTADEKKGSRRTFPKGGRRHRSGKTRKNRRTRSKRRQRK